LDIGTDKARQAFWQRYRDVRRAGSSAEGLLADADPQRFRVAVCEQMEDPQKPKSAIEIRRHRDVVRLVTPAH